MSKNKDSFEASRSTWSGGFVGYKDGRQRGLLWQIQNNKSRLTTKRIISPMLGIVISTGVKQYRDLNKVLKDFK
jgi:hypothetical protein